MASFVPSVESGQLLRRGPREVAEAKSSHASSPSYAFGSRGAATLKEQKERWIWKWAISQPSTTATWRLAGPWRTFSMSRTGDPSLNTAVTHARKPSVSKTYPINKPSLGLLRGNMSNYAAPFPGLRKTEITVVVALPRHRESPFVLVHPCGPLGSRLAATPLWSDSNRRRSKATSMSTGGKDILKEMSEIDAFSTPILQLASSPYVSTHRLDGGATSILVRLADVTHLMSLTPNPEFASSSPSASHSVSRVAQLNASLTEGRRHVDVALDPLSWGRAAIVDEGGGVWLWWEEKQPVEGRLGKTTKLVKLRSATSDSQDGFFRVAFGNRPDTVLVMSRHKVVELDADPSAKTNRSITLVSLPTSPGSTEVLTALDRTAPLRGGAFACVCTSKQVLWIDQTGSQPPILRWRHELGGEQDHDLGLAVFASPEDSPVQGDTVLVYQPSSGRVHCALTSNDRPAALVSDPWALNIPQLGGINTFLTFHPQEHEKLIETVTLVATGEDAFAVGQLSSAEPGAHDKGYEASSVLLLDNTASLDDPLSGPMSLSKCTPNNTLSSDSKDLVVPARWAWIAINDDDTTVRQFSHTEFEQQLREDEGVMDTITTIGELARETTYEGPPEIRSHVLRGIDYHPSTSTTDIANIPLSPYFPFSTANGSLLAPLHGGGAVANLAVTDPNLPTGTSQQQQAIRRLRNELFMSSQVVYTTDPRPQEVPVRDSTIDELFAEAAGQLSLNDRIPTLSFTILPRPQIANPEMGIDNGQDRTAALAAPDARVAHSLLHEWKLGAEPRHHEWQTAPVHTTGTHRIRSGPPIRRPPSQISAIRPRSRPVSPLPRLHPHSSPVRASAKTPASTERLHNAIITHSPPSPTILSETDTFPQTQIERGAYGARPEATAKVAKKKAAKRRHGGF